MKDICVVEFNASWNATNNVKWLHEVIRRRNKKNIN